MATARWKSQRLEKNMKEPLRMAYPMAMGHIPLKLEILTPVNYKRTRPMDMVSTSLPVVRLGLGSDVVGIKLIS